MATADVAPSPTFTPSARRLGVWAAWMGFALSEVYAIASGVAFASSGAPVESGPFLSIMALLVVLMGPFLVLSMVAVHAYAAPRHRPYALAALVFMGLCVAITSCINFSLLLVSSRPELFTESVRALFLPCKWPVPAFILDNFVWDWFFGISMLLAVPVFSGGRLRSGLRLAMLLSGVFCLVGLAWLAISPPQAIVLGILGWGAAGPIVFLLLAKVFGSTQTQAEETARPEQRTLDERRA